MARNIQANEWVYIPAARIGGMDDLPSAFWRTKVLEAERGKVKVQLRDQSTSEWIGSSLCHRNVGILILTLGDFDTEPTLLDPLTKSILHYCRLLVPDDQVRNFKLRSLSELSYIWKKEQANYSHIILVGHGAKDSIFFANEGWVDPEKFFKSIHKRGTEKKVFISLCCKTGYQGFGGVFSKKSICGQFIAPFQSVHGAIASQFAQTFLAYHLLQGETPGVAFNHARESTPGSTSFRLWQSGRLKAGEM